MGVKHAEQQTVVGAPPQRCFDALLEYETFPEWQSAVKWVDVVSRDGEGRGREVHFEVDAKIRSVRYELEYSYEPPHRITWDYVEGDVKDVSGEFLLDDADDGRTRATYRIGLDPGVWMPGPIRKILTDQVMKGAVDDLARRVTR